MQRQERYLGDERSVQLAGLLRGPWGRLDLVAGLDVLVSTHGGYSVAAGELNAYDDLRLLGTEGDLRAPGEVVWQRYLVEDEPEDRLNGLTVSGAVAGNQLLDVSVVLLNLRQMSPDQLVMVAACRVEPPTPVGVGGLPCLYGLLMRGASMGELLLVAALPAEKPADHTGLRWLELPPGRLRGNRGKVARIERLLRGLTLERGQVDSSGVA
ncbi:hypothetical protein AWW66_07200 [Micromonospora rosaria]|uniref:Uncharacterized protein n=1 Tax=Micromonospora rosaria TaxID=47874 RepID=A0A136PWX9_9ACTN|nr:hypothetical protein AWW66_07200 [Micromonospora rosaria]